LINLPVSSRADLETLIRHFVVGSNSSSVQFAEICQASFGSTVECPYMMQGNSAGTLASEP
jgi:hypothetical protein